MITLITGLPGSGKTLYAVRELFKNAESEDIRPAYADIEGLDTNRLRCWSLDSPFEWFNLPDGAIIVMDECQRVFPPRSNGSAVPEHVRRLETHRHHGQDIYLITQSPKLIDYHVRSLVGRHVHISRPYGTKRPRVYNYEGINQDPEPDRPAMKDKQTLDPALFDFYKSATEHTHFNRVPFKIYALMYGLPLFILITAFFAVYRFTDVFSRDTVIEVGMHAVVNELPVAAFESHVMRDGEVVSAVLSSGRSSFEASDYWWSQDGVTFVLSDADGPRYRVVNPPTYRLGWPVDRL